MRERLHVDGMSLGIFILITLLLGVLLFDLYWLAVWDSTTDSFDYFWIMGPVAAAMFAGILIAFLLPWKIKWSGLGYALLIPGLMIAVFTFGKQVNFRQLTESRAARITQAIEAYYTREGRYPQQLSQLTPGYLLLIPSPAIIKGENWCYQAGMDYFRLGYFDRDHWSSATWFGRMYSAKGQPPLEVNVCQERIDFLQVNYHWDALFTDSRNYTPTPEPGE